MSDARRVALGIAAIAAGLSQQAAGQEGLRAGDYECWTSSFSLSRGIAYEYSALGHITIDGRGTYRVSLTGNSGRYSLSSTGFAFIDGPLKPWLAVVEVFNNRPRIRLRRYPGTPPNPSGPGVGEHRCTWRAQGE